MAEWTVHIPIEAPDEAAALRLANAICGFVMIGQDGVHVTRATISRDRARRRVYCGRRLAPNSSERCNQPPDHPSPCPLPAEAVIAPHLPGRPMWTGSGCLTTTSGTSE